MALVGKGITFDTGGYDIKDDESMATMKSDMGGAAAVIGALLAIARSGIKANVTAVVAACENRVSGNAYLPGDVLRTMSGKTVEVINTDAEGRLTLIDAVTYAVQKENAFAVIDIATLTGGQVVSLGYRYSALISDSKVLTEMIQKASAACGEKVWQMPADRDLPGAAENLHHRRLPPHRQQGRRHHFRRSADPGICRRAALCPP